MALNERQQALCKANTIDFSDLKALILNCTLKPSGTQSHTEGLLKVVEAILEANAIEVEMLRPVDYDIPPGVYSDMREKGFKNDDWPALCERVMNADILVIGTPIWLGEESSVCRRASRANRPQRRQAKPKSAPRRRQRRQKRVRPVCLLCLAGLKSDSVHQG